MASDSSERIDDYCREKYGHTNGVTYQHTKTTN